MGRHGRRGLRGKARKTRDRSRAMRLAATQRITEFAEPTSEAKKTPPRIGRRSDFHPGEVVALGSVDQAAENPKNRAAQMELPLKNVPRSGSDAARAETPTARHETPAVLRIGGRRGKKHTSAGSGTVTGDEVGSVTSLIRQGAPLGRVPMASARGRGSDTFSITGFLCGCAIGSAAAAAILFIVAAVIR